MTSLREHFDDLADRAKHYDVTEKVIRRTRRRRHLQQRLAPAAAAVAVLAGTVVWVSTARGPAATPPGPGVAPPVTVVDATGPAQRGRLPWLPATWRVPPTAATLPADRGVGPAALAWCVRDGVDDAYGLLLRDGTVLRVPHEVASLSPDGRWLAYGPESDLRLRDLTGTADLSLGAVRPVAWSPGGAALALEPVAPDGRGADRVEVLEPATGLRHTVPVRDPAWWAPVGLLGSGEPVLAWRGDPPPRPGWTPTAGPTMDPSAGPDPVPTTAPSAPQPALTWPAGPGAAPVAMFLAAVDPGTGAQRALASAAVPGTGEFVLGPAMPLVDGPEPGTFVVQTYRTVQVDGAPAYRSGDLVVASAATGAAERLIRLPDSGPDGWQWLASAGPDGILLTRRSAGRTEIQLIDPDTGVRRVVSDVPAELAVLVAGADGYV